METGGALGVKSGRRRPGQRARCWPCLALPPYLTETNTISCAAAAPFAPNRTKTKPTPTRFAKLALQPPGRSLSSATRSRVPAALPEATHSDT